MGGFRVFIVRAFTDYGEAVAQRRLVRIMGLVLLVGLGVGSVLGLRTATLETRIPKLWVETGGRLDSEADYISAHTKKGVWMANDDSCEARCNGAATSSPASGGLGTCVPSAAAGSKPTDNAGAAVPVPTVTDSAKVAEERTVRDPIPQIVIVTPEKKGADMISRDILKELLVLHEAVRDMPVCVDAVTGKEIAPNADGTHCDACSPNADLTAGCLVFTWGDVCSNVVVPDEFAMFRPLVPCTRPTVLDCFREGSYDWKPNTYETLNLLYMVDPFAKGILKDEYGVVGFEHLPSIHNATDAELHAAVTGGCRGFATKAQVMQWEEWMIIGNPVVDPQTKVTQRADALQTPFLTIDAAELATRRKVPSTLAGSAILAWRGALVKLADDHSLAPDDPKRKYPLLRVSVLRSDAFDNALKDTTSSNLYLSAVGVGIMIIFVVLSLVATPYSAGSKRWGLGTAPLGVLGILIVVVDTVAALGFTSWLGVSFNATSLQVLPFLALGLGVDDLFLILHCYEAVDRDPDEYTTTSVRTGVARTVGRTFSHAGPSVTMTTSANFAAFLIGAAIPLPAVSTFCFQAAAVEIFNYVFLMLGMAIALVGWEHAVVAPQVRGSGTNQGGTAAAAAAAPVGASRQPHQHRRSIGGGPRRRVGFGGGRRPWIEAYAKCLLRPVTKALVVASFAMFLGVSVFFATTVEDGLDVSDIAPNGSPLEAFLEDRFAYFSSFEGTMITKTMDYACRQQGLHDFHSDLRNNTWVRSVPPMWLDSLQEFVNATDGMVPPGKFYSSLHAWYNDTGSALNLLSSQFLSFGWMQAKEAAGAGPVVSIPGTVPTLATRTGMLTFAKSKFVVDGLNSTVAYADMIRSVRGLCERAAAQGVDVFPEGTPFTYWEQYIGLRGHFWRGVGLMALVLAAIVVAFAMSPTATLLIVGVIGCIVVEIFGMMGAAAIKFSAIPAVSLITSIGISVAFVVHFALCYLSEPGSTRDERTRSTLGKMLLPVLQGGLSTFFSIVLLGFSEFRFVRQYFFSVFLLVCLIGLLNGLVLLPVLLSLVGPAAVDDRRSSCREVGPTAAPAAANKSRTVIECT